MKGGIQDTNRLFRFALKTDFTHLRIQSGHLQTVWMFFENLLHEGWNGQRIALLLVPMLCAPTFLSVLIVQRHFKVLDRKYFPIALKYEPRVFCFAFLNFRRNLFSPRVDFTNASTTISN